MLQEHSDSAARIPVVRYLNGTTSRHRDPEFETVAYATVDRRDVEYLRRFVWTLDEQPTAKYAVSSSKVGGKSVLTKMHRMVYERHAGPIPDGLTIDHKDHDGLNNRFENLRLATKAEQSCNQRVRSNNTSGFKGVHWSKQLRAYRADIRHGESFHLGQYPTAIEAGWAYNFAAHRVFKDFAWLNPIEDDAIPERRKAEIVAVLEGRYLARLEAAVAAGPPDRPKNVDAAGNETQYVVRRDSKTGYRGVVHDASAPGMYRATLRHAGKLLFFGAYPTKEEACVVYNYVAFRLNGDGAKLNRLPDDAVTAERRAELIVLADGRYLPRARASMSRPEDDRTRANSTTGYRGVTIDGPPARPFRASVRVGGKAVFLGRFATKEEAAIAFNVAAPRLITKGLALNLVPDGSVPLERIAEIAEMIEAKLSALTTA